MCEPEVEFEEAVRPGTEDALSELSERWLRCFFPEEASEEWTLAVVDGRRSSAMTASTTSLTVVAGALGAPVEGAVDASDGASLLFESSGDPLPSLGAAALTRETESDAVGRATTSSDGGSGPMRGVGSVFGCKH